VALIILVLRIRVAMFALVLVLVLKKVNAVVQDLISGMIALVDALWKHI